jgi:hypothetical protein
MHVPSLKKNLVSVAMLEDKGYDVVFSSGNSYLQHKATGQVKKIGIRVKNLYMLEVDGCSAMVGKEEKVVSGMRVNYGTGDWAIFIMEP